MRTMENSNVSIPKPRIWGKAATPVSLRVAHSCCHTTQPSEKSRQMARDCKTEVTSIRPFKKQGADSGKKGQRGKKWSKECVVDGWTKQLLILFLNMNFVIFTFN